MNDKENCNCLNEHHVPAFISDTLSYIPVVEFIDSVSPKNSQLSSGKMQVKD